MTQQDKTALKGSFQKDVNFASQLLTKESLLRGSSQLTLVGDEIVSASSNGKWKSCSSIASHYKENLKNYIFLLKDRAFFTIYVKCGKKKTESFSFGYCSCPNYDEQWLFEEIEDSLEGGAIQERIDKQFPSPRIIEQPPAFPERTLRTYLKRSFPNNVGLIETIVSLAKHPIYIRCDCDLGNVSKRHPAYHLSINFIEESRFRIKEDFSFLDFVKFVLDLVYGIKAENSDQYLKLTS